MSQSHRFKSLSAFKSSVTQDCFLSFFTKLFLLDFKTFFAKGSLHCTIFVVLSQFPNNLVWALVSVTSVLHDIFEIFVVTTSPLKAFHACGYHVLQEMSCSLLSITGFDLLLIKWTEKCWSVGLLSLLQRQSYGEKCDL